MKLILLCSIYNVINETGKEAWEKVYVTSTYF